MTGKKAKSPKAKKAKAPRASKSKKVTSETYPEAQKTATLVERKGISLWHPAAVVATFFSVGRIPFAPGTWGSLAAVVFFPLFLMPPLYVSSKMPSVTLVVIISVCILVLLYTIGVTAIKIYQGHTKTSDVPEIVYDEFFGQILTYVIAYTGFFLISNASDFLSESYKQAMIYQFVPFLFFRLFDVCKPWPINIMDKRENSATGVMFDDVLAAIYAATASIIVFLVMGSYI